MIKFSAEAMRRWQQIPDKAQVALLSNVYCSKCKDMVKIVDFEASSDQGDLILKGKCEICSNAVARLIEAN